ncbi:biotin synthase BioB [Candidatus Sumerlaeota bacterium]|nr:biotin synthase BioB [Candidatus Sumerlaeota bacterium]
MIYDNLAQISLDGGSLTDEQCLAVLVSPDADILSLLAAAYRVRRHRWGNTVQIHVLTNAKSGLCPEDCHYCSQSSVSSAGIDRYPLMKVEELVEAARRANEARARRYCMVISARGPADREVEILCEATRRIKSEMDLDICCSVGLLRPEQAAQFKAAGVDRINHNLNTSEKHYPNICTTHTYRDRVETLRVCREAGLELCSGAIFGQWEEDRDIIELAREFRRIGMESIPINFLITIDGTPFGELKTGLTPLRCLKILCLVRLINPAAEIRIAGGREVHLRSLQPLGLYPANSVFVRGYLTEPGQSADEAWKMIEDMGFKLEIPPPSEAEILGRGEPKEARAVAETR